MEKLIFKGVDIAYTHKGVGKCIVLLHGYLESAEIWSGFFNKLTEDYHVVLIDLLGHGKSGVVGGVSSMELMAEQVDYVLNHLNIKKCTLVGHSMGGYVALAFAERYSDKLSGYVICHSHPFADSESKKKDRAKAVEAIKQGKKELMVNSAIPNLYSDENRNSFSGEIENSKRIALNTKEEGIIAALNGMRDRGDKEFVLDVVDVPVLFLIGEGDNLIAADDLIKLCDKHDNAVPYVLNSSGHMGFIEEEEESIKALIMFIET